MAHVFGAKIGPRQAHQAKTLGYLPRLVVVERINRVDDIRAESDMRTELGRLNSGSLT